MFPSRILHTALAAALFAGSAAAQAPEFAPAPCPDAGVPADARCGTVRVPENRDAPGGRQLSLHVVVLPAWSAAPAREAVTFFGGGPGQAATDFAGWMGQLLAPLRETRDLLFVDQRGTGRSTPLECALRDPARPQSYLGPFLPPEIVARCRDALAPTADLTRYGFAQLAHDTDAVRQALGYTGLDLWGGSYGTRAALAYERMYPARVRSMVLDGLVPPAFAQPDSYAQDLDAALAGLQAYCRADAACGAAFPDFVAQAHAVAARLETAPGEAEIVDAGAGRPVRLSIGRGTFVETIRKMMYDAGSASRVPYVVQRAHAGDFAPVIRAGLADRRASAGMGWGLYLAITCSEDVPFIDPGAAARRDAGTLLRDYRIRQQAEACRGWPTFVPDPEHRQPVHSPVPALLISGELDPVTPPRWGEQAAAALPNGLHVIVPGAGHGYGNMTGGECMDSLVVRFFQQRSAAGLETACVGRMRRPPFLIQPPRTLTLDAAALGRLAGTYASEQPPFQARVHAVDGALVIHLSEGGVVLARPVSPARFVWEGSPPGWELVFTEDANTLSLRGEGAPPLVLTRQP